MTAIKSEDIIIAAVIIFHLSVCQIIFGEKKKHNVTFHTESDEKINTTQQLAVQH